MFDFTLRLPEHYRLSDVLNFHGRDSHGLCEEVSPTRLRKGILLGHVPTVFDIEFDQTLKEAHCVVEADGEIDAAMQLQAETIASSLLGLRLDPEAFVDFVATDAVFGPLAQRQRGLRIVQSSSIFEALTWAVLGQQINVAFAVSLRRSFVQLAGRRHSSGLYCYPAPADAAHIALEEFTSRQYSRSKAQTLLRLSEFVASGQLDLEESPSNPLADICQALLAVKGIGPWTVNYVLLRGYGHADCSLHGDVAVRAAIARLWGHETRPGTAETEEFLKRYSPHRTMAAAHLWASHSKQTEY